MNNRLPSKRGEIPRKGRPGLARVLSKHPGGNAEYLKRNVVSLYQSTTSKENERTLSKPSPIRSRFAAMGRANVPTVKAFTSRLVCFLRK